MYDNWWVDATVTNGCLRPVSSIKAYFLSLALTDKDIIYIIIMLSQLYIDSGMNSQIRSNVNGKSFCLPALLLKSYFIVICTYLEKLGPYCTSWKHLPHS